LARRGRVLRATLHYERKVVPFLISFGLVTWLIWKVTPEKLLVVLSTSSWPWLLLASLLNPDGNEAELLAFGLIWSTVVIVGRVLIGLVSSWLPHVKEETKRVDESVAAQPNAGSTAA
jgi:hypothetical protein